MADRDNEPVIAARGNLFLRIVWMAAPPVAFVYLVVAANVESWTLRSYDFALAIVVLAGIVARAIDVLRFGGTTGRGQPATPADVVRYAFAFVLVIGLLRVVTQVAHP